MIHINGRGVFTNTTEINPDEVENQVTVYPDAPDHHIGSSHYIRSRNLPPEGAESLVVSMEKGLKGKEHLILGGVYGVLFYRKDERDMPTAGQLNFAMRSWRSVLERMAITERAVTDVTFEEAERAPGQQDTELICIKGIVRALFNVADGTQSYKRVEA